MRAILMGLVMLLGATLAMPAAAQNGGYAEKMLGRWCGRENDGTEFCIVNQRAGEGHISFSYTAQKPGGEPEQVSIADFASVDGVLTLRSESSGTLYREVPHGPNELVLENAIPEEVKRGAALRIRYVVDKDTLIVEFFVAGGRKAATQRYDRAPPIIAQRSSFAWLSGGWCTVPDKGEQVCEAWSDEIAGGVAGISSTRKGGVEVSSERMSIGMSGGKLTFIAMPSGASAPTHFALVSRGAAELVFENRDHDYPQRIRYWREGEVLMAEISLADGSKPMRWRYERVKP